MSLRVLRSTPAERPAKGDEGWWVGRENATLPESSLSHENCLTSRRARTHCWPPLFFGTFYFFKFIDYLG
jgi:hypothetical protein